MTIHGLKSELKQLRYLESYSERFSSLFEAITFDPTVGFSKFQVFWKLYIHTFPLIPRPDWSEFRKASKSAAEDKTRKTKKGKTVDVSKKHSTCTKCMPGTDDMHLVHA